MLLKCIHNDTLRCHKSCIQSNKIALLCSERSRRPTLHFSSGRESKISFERNGGGPGNLFRGISKSQIRTVFSVHGNNSVSHRLFSSSAFQSATTSITAVPSQLTAISLVAEKEASEGASIDSLSIHDSALDLSNDSITVISDPELASSVIESTFASIGLAHGWPSGWMQWIMEMVHVDLGLSWCGTIVLSK